MGLLIKIGLRLEIKLLEEPELLCCCGFLSQWEENASCRGVKLNIVGKTPKYFVSIRCLVHRRH